MPLKTVDLFQFVQYYYQGDNGTLNNAVGNIFPVIRYSACAGVGAGANRDIRRYFSGHLKPASFSISILAGYNESTG